MAQQKFSNAFREALWQTYGKKCFHCTGELLLAEMRIDHIIPERLHRDGQAKREEVLTSIGLRLDFNILGTENLAPSCDRCNGQKNGSVLVGRSAAVALTRIARNLDKLEKNLKKKREARKLEDVLLAVARSIDSGHFTRDEFLRQFDIVVKSYLTRPELQTPARTSKTMETKLLDSSLYFAVFQGITVNGVIAEKQLARPNRYFVRGETPLEGFKKLDVVFDVIDDMVDIVAAHYG